MFKNDLLRRGQAETCAMRFRSKKRFEKFRLNLTSESRPVVLHANEKEAVNDFGFNLHHAITGHRFDCIPYKVLEDLAQKTLIKPHLGSRWYEAYFDINCGRRLEIFNKLLDH